VGESISGEGVVGINIMCDHQCILRRQSRRTKVTRTKTEMFRLSTTHHICTRCMDSCRGRSCASSDRAMLSSRSSSGPSSSSSSSLALSRFLLLRTPSSSRNSEMLPVLTARASPADPRGDKDRVLFRVASSWLTLIVGESDGVNGRLTLFGMVCQLAQGKACPGS
jgi:hypothetical protein